MKEIRTNFKVSGILFLVFGVFTLLTMTYDVQPIGPEKSLIGFAGVNQFVFGKLGVNLLWYEVTDWLGLVAVMVALGFGVLGLFQWIKRKSLFKVDLDILALGIYYALVVGLYVLFEIYIVNYRPILLHGNLEASFPSSHTMIVLCIMGTAIPQFRKRVKNQFTKRMFEVACVGVIAITVVGRLISGVHWFTDIVAGLLLGMAFVMLYISMHKWIESKEYV